MSEGKQSYAIFKLNILFWKIFGIWPGNIKHYKYFSLVYLSITLAVYNALLTFNLIYTPKNIEALIREVIFYFTEVVVTAKVLMVLLMKNKIDEAFDMLDSEIFVGDTDEVRVIVESHISKYKRYWTSYAAISNFAFSSQVFFPLFISVFSKASLQLPICNYYFLSDDLREDYFVFWYIYQSAAMYGHMMYNVNIDTFISGLIMMGIGQFKTLEYKLRDIKCTNSVGTVLERMYDRALSMKKLCSCVIHHHHILKYCSILQNIFNVTMFFQFAVSSAIVCVILCALLLPWNTETYIFMVSYLFAMTLQIFVPCWLGNQLSHESEMISEAAYHTAWIAEPGPFRRSLVLLMQRSLTPVLLTGLNMLPLSLSNFVAIIKAAYSLFTLLRSAQE